MGANCFGHNSKKVIMNINEILEHKQIDPHTEGLIKKMQESSKYKVVKVGADWCPPCVRLKPYFHKSEEENPNIDFHDVNIKGKGEPEEYTFLTGWLKVTGIPAVFVFDGENNLVKRIMKTGDFMEEVNSILNKDEEE